MVKTGLNGSLLYSWNWRFSVCRPFPLFCPCFTPQSLYTLTTSIDSNFIQKRLIVIKKKNKQQKLDTHKTFFNLSHSHSFCICLPPSPLFSLPQWINFCLSFATRSRCEWNMLMAKCVYCWQNFSFICFSSFNLLRQNLVLVYRWVKAQHNCVHRVFFLFVLFHIPLQEKFIKFLPLTELINWIFHPASVCLARWSKTNLFISGRNVWKRSSIA